MKLLFSRSGAVVPGIASETCPIDARLAANRARNVEPGRPVLVEEAGSGKVDGVATCCSQGAGQKWPFKILTFVDSVAASDGATDETPRQIFLQRAGTVIGGWRRPDELRGGKSGVVVKSN